MLLNNCVLVDFAHDTTKSSDLGYNDKGDLIMIDKQNNIFEGDEIDIIGFVKALIRPIIKQKTIILSVLIFITVIGIIIIFSKMNKYEVNYYIKNGIKNISSEKIEYSINPISLNNWLESEMYRQNEKLSNYETHFPIKSEIIGQDEIIKLTTYTDDIEQAKNYLKIVVDIIEAEPIFNQQVFITKNLIKERIEILEQEIIKQEVRLSEYEKNQHQMINNSEIIKKNIEYNRNIIINIQKRMDEIFNSTNDKNNHIIETYLISENNALLNLQNANITYQNILKEFGLTEKLNETVIHLNIRKLKEELLSKTQQLELLNVINGDYQVMIYTNNSKRLKNMIAFIIIGIIIAYICGFLKEYYYIFKIT